MGLRRTKTVWPVKSATESASQPLLEPTQRLPETMAASSNDLRVGRDAARGHQRASSAKTRSAGEGGASAQRQAVQAPRALAYHLRSRQSPMRLRRSGGSAGTAPWRAPAAVADSGR
nr:unnamed protein product [Digitaria exilis]